MRKQYHFFPGETGLDAWDVDRLVALSADLPREDVDVSSIKEIDSAYWFEGESPTVREIVEHLSLIEAADLSHPIILGADGRVMDGMHRVAKALLEGRKTIKAVRLTTIPEPDFTNVTPEQLPYEEE